MNAEAVAEVKTCLHCPKKLRADNKRGICSDCAKAGKVDINGKTTNDINVEQARARRGGDVVKLPRATRRVQPPPKRSGADLTALAKFRVVADTIRPGGRGADELLEEFAARWLESVRKAAK